MVPQPQQPMYHSHSSLKLADLSQAFCTPLFSLLLVETVDMSCMKVTSLCDTVSRTFVDAE